MTLTCLAVETIRSSDCGMSSMARAFELLKTTLTQSQRALGWMIIGVCESSAFELLFTVDPTLRSFLKFYVSR